MSGVAELTDQQLERRVAKADRRARRQNIQKQIIPLLDSRTWWGKVARPSQIRAGAKLMAARIVAAERRQSLAEVPQV